MTENMAPVAKFKVSTSLLRDLLHMPEGSVIMHVEDCEGIQGIGQFWVTATSPGLPYAPIQSPPEVTPWVTNKRVTWHWGVEDEA